MIFLRGIFRRTAAIISAAVLLFIMNSCGYLPLGATSIKEILANPAQYDGKTVKVRGIVSDITKIPLMDIRFYTLDDEGSQLMVYVTGDMPAPKDNIMVVGTLENVVIVKSINLGLHLKENKRYVDYFK